MSEFVSKSVGAETAAAFSRTEDLSTQTRLAGRVLVAVLKSFLLSLLIVVCVETIARGGFREIPDFILSPSRPGMTTVTILMLVMLILDALFGRAYQSALVVVPLTFIPAFVSDQKQLYLSDPLYPTDFLFARQIMELMPVMIKDRPGAAIGVVLGLVASVAALVYIWRFAWKRFPALSHRARFVRLGACLPLVLGFVSMMDYAQFSWTRDRLQVIPMMWDQKENYFHNGFIMAFSLNLPMANVSAPAGYMTDAIDKIATPRLPVVAVEKDKPDVIVLMSESFWDPTRLTNLQLTPDPMPTVRNTQSGSIFSPEFGGMTANVEFEALTGFSNAFLPYGSIPYQQYIRNPIPSLATFFRGEGYAARSIHPFRNWFWNRSAVYKAFGFEEFKSEENLPPMEKRGIFASDEALTKEIIREADGMDKPFFFFTVTLQGHGPYEPNRYVHNSIDIGGNLPDGDRATLATYTQGVKEADDNLKKLMDWARTRDRETIIVLFGDHLPPLGTVYTNSGYMTDQVASRKAPIEVMKKEHETPLVIWSSKTGTRKNVGSISPAFLSYHLLKTAGLDHPFYTGFLGRVQRKYSIIDRYQLVARDGKTQPDWSMKGQKVDPLIRDYRFLQHDIMFGKRYGLERFFPTHADVTGQGS